LASSNFANCTKAYSGKENVISLVAIGLKSLSNSFKGFKYVNVSNSDFSILMHSMPGTSSLSQDPS
jgi:hypothetical protein